MNAIRTILGALALASTFTLAACNSGTSNADQTNATPNQPPAASAQPTAPLNKLTADQVNVQLTLQGEPTISADGKSIAVTVNLANNGKTTLSSKGENGPAVNLGAHSVDTNGKIIDMDLSRATLNAVVPGSQAAATILLPIDRTLGKSAQILPVQEGVAWFDTWGTKPLTVGPFANCADAATGKVCGADGKPLATATAH
jgi:hypothetical protein